MALTKIDDRGLKTPIDLLDNEKIRLGTGNDLELYHDGSHSYIKDTGTGNLRLLTSSVFTVNNAANSQNMILATDGGAVELFHAGNRKLHTAAEGIKVFGPVDSNCDVILWADNGTDWTDGVRLRVSDAGPFTISGYNASGTAETFIEANINGAVELYHNNVKKFETTSSGATVTGGLYCSAGQQIQITGSAGSVGLQLIGQDADYSLIGTMGAHDLMFRTSSAERMRIAANGVLWHGVAPFANHFTNRSAYFHKSGSSDWNYVSITGGTSGGAGIVFGDSVGNNTGNYESLIAHDNTNNSLYLKTHQTAKGLEIKVGGDVSIIDGNLVVASGHGIDFSATSDATGKTSELLDNYEEGSFTPVITGATHSDLGSYGRYVRVGKLVTISVRIQISASAIGGGVTVTGLPFTPITGTGENYTSGGITYYDMPSSITNFDPYITAGTAIVYFFEKGSGTQLSFSSTFTAKYLGFSAMYYA